jgi:transcriptional regulator with XRE-family HTH domain
MGVAGEQLKAERRAHKVSQQRLAERIGVSRQTLWAWESRGSVPIPDAERYRAALREVAGTGDK